MEHEHSECHHSSLFVIGGIQGVTSVPCYNCTWSPLHGTSDPHRFQCGIDLFLKCVPNVLYTWQ